METVNRQSKSASKQRASIAAAAASALLAVSSPLFAADKAWSTAPAGNAFSGTNWTPGNVAGAASTTLVSGDALFFGATSTVFLNNDLSGFNFAGVTFNSGAPAYTIAGNAFTLTGNLVNNSTATQTILNSITLAQNTTITSNTGALFLGSSINGGAFSLAKTGTGLLTLGSANAYSGGTTISGVLNASVNGALGTGGVAVNAGAGNQLQLGNGVNLTNAVTVNGGGIAVQGVIYVPTGNATLSGPINLTFAQNAGGIFATGNNASVLTVAGDNNITGPAQVTIRNGRVVYTGAQSYTGGTFLQTAGSLASIQFGKINSMPATGTVIATSGTSVIVNAGGVGEFTAGDGTATAGTVGGLLGGVGGQGAGVTLPAGSSIGVDTTNATAPVVFNTPYTSANNVGLLKLGTGTLTLAAGGTFNGGGAGVYPLTARQGTLDLTGGTTTVNGEAVVGGAFGTAAGAPGLDATLQIDNGATLAVTGYLSVGRGNGVGVASSNLVVNNGTVNTGELSLGFNAGSALNLVKGSITLNNASTLNLTGTNFNFAESPGSNGTLTLNGTSAINLTSAAGVIHLGNSGTANVVLNDAAQITAANNNFNFFVGRQAGSNARLTLNGTSKVTQTGAAAGLIVGDGGRGVVDIASTTAAVSTNALLIGHFGATTGVVYNKGTLANLTGGIFMGDGAGSSSYLRNDNAVAATPNAVAGNIIAGITNNSTAVVDVVSGRLEGQTVGGGFYQPGTTTNGQFNVSGGELHAGTFGFQVGNGVTGLKTVDVNVTGGTFSSTGPVNLGVANNAGNSGVLTVNTGGTVVADTITSAGTTAASAVNFGGGVLKADPLGTTPALITANVGRVQLNASGGTIDTNGVNKSVDAVITDPLSTGVTAISLSGTGTGYIGRPYVKITDSTGTGATAVADFNPATGEVTGVTITSPGSNYTNPSITIIGGGGTALTALPVLDFSLTGSLAKTGAGTLTLTGANSYTGSTIVSAGTLKATTPAYTNILANTGGLDLHDTGRAVLDYTGGSSPVAQVKALLDAAAPAQFFSGQIRSTLRPANTTIGYGDNGTDSVTIIITLAGDADLDRDVDFNDFLVLQTNFGAAGTRFDQGNFNYDGSTDFNDFLSLQTNFGQSLPGGAAVAFTSEQVAAITAFGLNPTNQAVPEPASLALLGLASAGLLRRRRA